MWRPTRIVQVHQAHLLGVGRQPTGHVGQPQEDGVPDEVEQGRRGQPGALADHGAIAPAPAVAAVLQGLVGRPADGVLDKPVAGDPAGLLPMLKLRPQGRD